MTVLIDHDPYVVPPLLPAERDPAPPKPAGTITVDAVPPAQRPQPMPIIRVLMPVVMVAAMVAMVAVMLAGGRAASPMMLVLPLMMGVSMLMMFAPPQSEGDVDETRRTYLRHLGAVREKALTAAAGQRAHELHRHPAPADLLARIGTPRMWERHADDPDTLEVRLGVGRAALSTAIEVKDSGAAEDLEPVCAVSLRRMLHAISTVDDMPVVVQLKAFRFLSLAGAGAHELARCLIAQLSTAHGPDTVGIEVVGDGLEHLKWLPHAHDPAAAAHRILFVSDTPTTGTEDFLDDPAYTCIIELAPRPGASALGMRAENEGLLLLVESGLSVVTAAGVEELGVWDRLTDAAAVQHARAMTGFLRPAGVGGAGRVRNDLLELAGIDGVDALRPHQIWPERAGHPSRLVVPLGVSENGAAVRLDLKESAQGGVGPHGLCIGATGSGKSELLKTLVTGLAATHSPSDLNLVLVDFKGGATFLGCEGLPHTAAVITNLEDEAVLVERMYDALSGELNRRQEFLREAGNFANITDYAAQRGDREPLPALLIVVDEFSELLGQHPDFADLFVAVGRLGRSLGVHLLLASQRLEEGKLRGLDSHLSYRIGLKTFSAAESRQVLGVPDAHQLPARPGAGYLRTSGDTLTRFQAAYVSGPVERRVVDQTRADTGARVEPFTSAPAPAETPTDSVTVDESTTLLDAVVAAARDTAAQRTLSARKIWLDPLPARIELSAVADQDAGRHPVIGIIDRPYHQRQDPLRIDTASGGGHVAVCGGPQTGKSGTVRTLVASLALGNPTSACRFYIVDLGGGALEVLTRLPHVAGYAGRGQDERIRRIIDEVGALIDDPLPGATFLVIDGWHAIATTGSELDDLVDPVTTIATDGPAAGVHLIMSTPRWTTLRPAIRDLITHRVELKLAESLDSVVDRKAQQKLPHAPGRGLAADAAPMLVAHTSTQDIEHIRARTADQPPVPALKVLPDDLALAELDSSGSGGAGAGIEFGIGGPRLDTLVWRPDTDSHLVVVGAAESGKSTALATVMAQVSGHPREAVRLVVLDPRRAHLGTVAEDMLAAYAASTTAIGEAVRNTAATLQSRLPGPEISAAELLARSWWTGPEIYLVIDDLDLVPAADLHPLVELLPHARDIGFHLVVARKSGGIGRALFSGLLSALRDEQPAALVLSADRDDGQIFGVKPTLQPPGRGTYVTRGVSRGTCQIARKR